MSQSGVTLFKLLRWQLLHLWPNVITLVTFITFVTKCYYNCDLYYICDQLLHLCLVHYKIQCEQQTKIQSTVKEASGVVTSPYFYIWFMKRGPQGRKELFLCAGRSQLILRSGWVGLVASLPRLSRENRRSVNRLDLTWQSSTSALATEGIPLKETEFIACGFDVGNSVPILCAPILLRHLYIENCWHNYIFPSLLQTKPILKCKFPFYDKSYLLKI